MCFDFIMLKSWHSDWNTCLNCSQPTTKLVGLLCAVEFRPAFALTNSLHFCTELRDWFEIKKSANTVTKRMRIDLKDAAHAKAAELSFAREVCFYDGVLKTARDSSRRCLEIKVSAARRSLCMSHD